MCLSVQAIHKVGSNFPILQIIKSISKQVRLNHTVYELYLNKRPCQLLRPICFLCLGQENTRNARLQLLSTPQRQPSLPLQKHRRRCTAPNKTELLAPASRTNDVSEKYFN